MTNAVRDPLTQSRLDLASARIAQLDAKILDFERRHPGHAVAARLLQPQPIEATWVICIDVARSGPGFTVHGLLQFGFVLGGGEFRIAPNPLRISKG